MSLIEWRSTPPDVEPQVRGILERSGEIDTSTAACKRWVRRLIRVYVPTWEPGDNLAWSDTWRIGAAFERLVSSPRPAMPERIRKQYTRRSVA